MVLVRNKKPITCATCSKECQPGEGWAWKGPQGWVPLCDEHKPEEKPDILGSLRAGGHTVKLQGKEYVLFSGLLMMAHENGLQGCNTEIAHMDIAAGECVMVATVTGSRGTFNAHGDATPANTSKMVRTAFIRMAETRAVCRALRLYLGTGMTAFEELPGKDS